MYLSPSEELVLVPVRENKKERLCLFERLRREPTPFGPQTMGWDSQFTSNAKVVRFLSCRERYLFLCARAASRVEEETRASRHASTAGTRANISSHTRGGSRGTSASRHVVVVVVDDETPLAGSTAGRSLASGRGSKSHLARGSASRTAWRKYPFMDQCSLPRAARRCARSVASLAKGPDFFRSSLIKPVSSERGVVASRVCARASAAGPQSSAPSSRRPHVASGMRAHSPGVPDPRIASPCAPGGVARRAG